MIKKLLNLKLKFTKNQKGLTLIELLVVIVILGIIAAIAIPAVLTNRTDAAKGTNEQNAAIIQDAVNRYEAVNGVKPVAATTAALLTELNKTDKGGPYLESMPKVKTFSGCTVADFSYTYTAASGTTAASGGKVTLDANCLPATSNFIPAQ